MERVKDMPVRFVALQKFEHIREDGKVFIFLPGEVYEDDVDSFKIMSRIYPDAIQEIYMTREDWIDLGTARALKCKKRIKELEQLYGQEFTSYHYCVIPISERGKVDGRAFDGGLPEAYGKTHYLERDVKIFEQLCLEDQAFRKKYHI